MNLRFVPLIPTLLTVIFIVALNWRLESVPPLLELLSPMQGLWQTPLRSELQPTEYKGEGLEHDVLILWDESRVPHFEAKSESDLAWAQGFVHASQRLFQMELQARAGGGRLSEFIGPKTLKMDRFYIKMGFRHAARKALQEMNEDPETRQQIQAYVDGVNAWIDQLRPSTLPTEYRLLQQMPARWTPMQVAEFFIVMGYRLSGRTFDLIQTRLAKKWGKEKIQDLFPEFMPLSWEAPIYKNWQPPRMKKIEYNETDFSTALELDEDLIQPFASNGSNSWAIAPARSQTGAVILANDTHLGFTLPGLWFEQELKGPSTHVYGGGFAGVPGVMSGFTERAAWGVTNGTTDVVDWYDVEFQDTESLFYKTQDGFKPATLETEEIHVRSGESEKVALLWTHLGPVFQRQNNHGLVVRWTLHDGGDPVAVFRALSRSHNAEECNISLVRFKFPIQNFLCADAKNISLRHAGLIPVRSFGQGRFVMNALNPQSHWRGFLTFEQQPQLRNPEEGFVASANQRPVSQSSPVSLGWESENGYRGRRVVELLRQQNIWSVEEIMQMQTDSLNPLAREVLPDLLSMIKGLSVKERGIAERLAAWDFKDQINSIESSIFYHWWARLRERIWRDQLGESTRSVWPKDERLALLIERGARRDSQDDFWVDDINTEALDSLDEIATESFQEALKELELKFGPSPQAWPWGRVRRLQLPHVGRLPGFQGELSAPGSRYALNAMQVGHGPTWRMIVALGDHPRAWTSVQGSSAGEPLSSSYVSGLEEWGRGLYKNVLWAGAGSVKDLEQESRVLWTIRSEREGK